MLNSPERSIVQFPVWIYSRMTPTRRMLKQIDVGFSFDFTGTLIIVKLCAVDEADQRLRNMLIAARRLFLNLPLMPNAMELGALLYAKVLKHL